MKSTFKKLWSADADFMSSLKANSAEVTAKLEFQQAIMEAQSNIHNLINRKVEILKDVKHLDGRSLVEIYDVDQALSESKAMIASFASTYKFLFGEDLEIETIDTNSILDQLVKEVEKEDKKGKKEDKKSK